VAFSVEVGDSQRYMWMALRLARRGVGSVEPNPAVGAVIVKANQVIGKGYHKEFGRPHAEINALEDCAGLGVKPNGATMYVTLEPGDIIATGTPSGVGFATGNYLKAGDRIEATIDKLGTLTNTLGPKPEKFYEPLS